MEAESGPIPDELIEEAGGKCRCRHPPGRRRRDDAGSANDAPVNRVIKAVGEVTSVDERSGRVAGGLLGAARSTSTVDAVMVASAIELGGGIVLTGDPEGLEPLTSGHLEVAIRPL
jgi:hypothetical protein